MTLEKEIAGIIDRGNYALWRVWDRPSDSDNLMDQITYKYFLCKGGDGDITFTILRKYGIFPDKYCVYIKRGCEISTRQGVVPSMLTANFTCKNREDYEKIKQHVDSGNSEKVIDMMTKRIFDREDLILPPLENLCINKWDSLLEKNNTSQEFQIA